MESSTGTVRVTVELTAEAYAAIEEIARTLDLNETEAFHVAIAKGLEAVRQINLMPGIKHKIPSARSVRRATRS
ncbi:MAG TPA: hypothetical protein VGR26_13215 [Acidimicrobiales bacterium]|nr:hypothetical protein [Acidimicrobiales bacterium]